MYHMKYAKESAYIHTYIHDFILYRIFRVAQKLISSRDITYLLMLIAMKGDGSY